MMRLELLALLTLHSAGLFLVNFRMEDFHGSPAATPDYEPRFEDLWRLRACELRQRYLEARPYSHLADQDLFPNDLILAAELEELPRALTLPIHSSHRERRADS